MRLWERFSAVQACRRMTLAVYRATKSFPADERFGLTSQIRRAALSTGANVVEGSALRGSKQFARHLGLAVGSFAELEYLLLIAADLEYLDAAAAAALGPLVGEAALLTRKLLVAVRRHAERSAA